MRFLETLILMVIELAIAALIWWAVVNWVGLSRDTGFICAVIFLSISQLSREIRESK